MSERIIILKKIEDKLFVQGCPVIVEAGSLLKDNQTGKVLVQLKLRNVSYKKIESCKICIEAYEPNGDKVGDTRYNYMDLNVSSGETFGDRIPVFLKSSSTRKFEISIIETVDISGNIWKNDGSETEVIPAQERIEDKLTNPEEIKQYKIEVGTKGSEEYVPMIHKGLFMCTCGTINLGEKSKCWKCGREYEVLSSILNKGLKERTEKRLAEEKYQRKDGIYNEAINLMEKNTIDSYRKAKTIFDSISGHKDGADKSEECELAIQKLEREAVEKAKKTKKRLISVSSIIATAIIITIVISIVVTQAIIPSNKYNEAQTLFNEGKWEEAYNAFLDLGDYRDSSQKAIESKYQNANKLEGENNYEEAIKFYSGLGDYKDSSHKVMEIEKLLSKDRAASLKETIMQFDSKDEIVFGKYKKDGILWIILEKNETSALLVSKLVLDDKEFNKTHSKAIWETSSIREWLNNEFFNESFNDYEKEMIKPENIKNGNLKNTKDKVFLLSIDEVNRYFESDEDRIAKKNDGISSNWYLRSCSKDSYSTYVYVYGQVMEDTENNKTKCGIRPAMWVSLE